MVYKNVDSAYKELVENILKNGSKYLDPNRAGVSRIEINSYLLEIDVSKYFPILSLRDLPYKNGLMELMVFLSGSNDIRDLWENRVNFWDKDWGNYVNKSVVTGDINKLTTTLKEFWKDGDDQGAEYDEVYSLGDIYPKLMRNFHGVDQIANMVKTLETNPNATKQTITMWDPSSVNNQALTPCHFMFQILPIKDSKTLDLKWSQHSVDTFLGLPTNIVYYAGMLHYICWKLGYKPGKIIGDLSNVHLYDNALDKAREIITRHEAKIGDLPELYIPSEPNPNLSFDQELETIKDWEIRNYNPQGKLKVEMLAYSK